MTVNRKKDGTSLVLEVEGRIDTTTAPELQKELDQSIEGITDLVFDFSNVSYISSAGLRVLITAQKIMNKQGSMEIHHVNEMLMEIFEVTGFTDILTIR